MIMENCEINNKIYKNKKVWDDELNAEYDGMFIYFNADVEKKTSTHTAIKPYW